MLLLHIALFLVSFFVVLKSADYAVTYSSKIARTFHFSEFIVSFFIITFISAFPEATISIISALEGSPEFGLGTLIGSNVADLSLVFGIVALFSLKGITVKSEIIKNDFLYLLLLLVPIILGFDGHLSQSDGIVLIVSGVVFFMTIGIESKLFKKKFDGGHGRAWVKNFFLLILSMLFLIGGAHFTVQFGIQFANDLQIPPFLVALTLVAVGTCLPELLFSIRAVKTHHDELALGDILGTVITDATILVGVIALIRPFDFNPMIIYVTGTMMFLAGALVILFIKTEKVLTKKAGILLLLFYIVSLIIEFIVNRGA